MKVTIEVSRRTAWRLHRVWRWILRTVPGAMELIGTAMVLVGGFFVFGEGGNYECGELVHVSVLVGALVSVAVGISLLWVVKEIDEALAEDIRRKRKRMERHRR